MGINWHGAKFLIDMVARGHRLGGTATIGRLDFNTTNAKARELLRRGGLTDALSADEAAGQWRYSEPFLEKLGATSVMSVDASHYEGASILADLNQPLPADLAERFDTVIDGGTIEHVFDIKLCLSNQMSMVKRGGNLIINTMANNWVGHGFYQFSPELFYRVFAPENGFRIARIVMHESNEFAPWYEVPDPAAVQSRIELSNPWHGVEIIVHAVREDVVPLFARPPQQSDYFTSWQQSGTGSAVPEAAVAAPEPAVAARVAPGLKRRMIGALKARLPGLVAIKHRLLFDHPAITGFFSARATRRAHRGRSFDAQPGKFRRMR